MDNSIFRRILYGFNFIEPANNRTCEPALIQPRLKTVRGLRMPAGVDENTFLSALNYPVADGYIFVCSYPKCGTTWIQHILWLIRNQGQPIPANKSLLLAFPFLETMHRRYIETLPSPRMLKTHLPLDYIPMNPHAKYIYITRNPYDAVVSAYYHTKGFPSYYFFEEGSFEDYFECYCNGWVDYNDYFDHLAAWYDVREQPHVHFVTYEDWSSDFDRQLERLLHFLGEAYMPILQQPDMLDAIRKHSHFEQMRQNQMRWISTPRPEDLPFVRKGKVGDWRSLLSPTQFERLKDKLLRYRAASELYGHLCW